MSPAGGQQIPSQEIVVQHATCLGCGCACDDITVRVFDGRITETINTCRLGATWFADGLLPSAIRIRGRDAALNDALTAIATTLTTSRRPLIYLAPELSCEAQREATALADYLHGDLDTVSSATVLRSILAAQERGRTSATFGEIRNRADVIVFWGVDPEVRYPRYWSRYAPEPSGLHVENGRRSRRVIAIDVGEAKGPVDADARVTVDVRDEVALLSATAAILRTPGTSFGDPLTSLAQSLVAQLTGAKYVAIVIDGEPMSASSGSDVTLAQAEDPERAAALIALAHALNGPTRCALSTLRGGGNRSGAEAVLTAQTGFPTGISFASGAPAYRPHDAGRGADAVLIVGDAAQIPVDLRSQFPQDALAIVGPRASTQTAMTTIDTGIAGIHVNGTALRMDDVPLRLRPSLLRGLDPAELLRALTKRVIERGADVTPQGGSR